jgi:hypothetical protein
MADFASLVVLAVFGAMKLQSQIYPPAHMANSGLAPNLAKVGVEGSNPFARSTAGMSLPAMPSAADTEAAE